MNEDDTFARLRKYNWTDAVDVYNTFLRKHTTWQISEHDMDREVYAITGWTSEEIRANYLNLCLTRGTISYSAEL